MPTGTILLRVAEPIARWHWGDSPTVNEKTGEIGDEHTCLGGVVNRVENPSAGFLDAIISAVDANVLSVVDAADLPGQDDDGHAMVEHVESDPVLAKRVADGVEKLAQATDTYLAALDKHRSKVWMENVDEFGVISDEGRKAVEEALHEAAPGLAKKAAR